MFGLFVLMGVSWLMEVISFWVGRSAYIWIPTDIINICTGIVVFVLFVMKPNVWKMLKTKYPSLKRLDVFCLPCILEQSSNHYRGKRRSNYPNQQNNIQTVTTSFNSEEESSSRKMSSTLNLNLISESG